MMPTPETFSGSEDSANIALKWGVKIAMRDGVQLNVTLYTPRDQRAPAPCICGMTPYISDGWHLFGVYFAARGMPFAIVDVRGRGNSEGLFHPHVHEAKDGYDVVEWLARQPCCNGNVAMYGASYLGYAQWATAKERPPHLRTIVPTAAPYLGVDVPMRSNVFYPYNLQWLFLTSGRALQAKISGDRAFWSGVHRRWHESGRSFRDLDAEFGNPSPIFQEDLDHPEPDAHWDAQNPTPEEYARLDIPILTITGSYDDDQPGALEHYKQHIRHAPPEARARHFVIIGPWDHSGTQWPVAEFGGLKLCSSSVIDMRKLHWDWYAWTMVGAARPEFLKKPVIYYVLGAEQWRYANTLEDVTARHEPYFLDSVSNANDVFSSGSLGVAPGKGKPDMYTYDPRDTQGLEVDAEARADGQSLVDQSVTLALRGKLLVYHSTPFEKDSEISGFFKLSAWIAIDCPDTDFYVSVHEVCLHGGSVRLSADAMRARYRTGLRTPKLINTREPLRYAFEHFTFISRRVKRGHRLRLVIAPVGRLVEGLFAQKNYNGGGVVAEECVEDGRPVTVRLFHDETHPSALHVPFGESASTH